MKTDELIAALVVDRPARSGWPIAVSGALALCAGLVIAGAGEIALAGLRTGGLASFLEWRAALKLAFCIGMAIAAWRIFISASAPDARGLTAGMGGVALPVGALVLAGVWELAGVAHEQWSAVALGTDPAICLASIATCAALPFVFLCVVMRAMAPGSPAAAGLATGLLAGSAGAIIYALHCTDDAPAFVVLWYTLGIILVGSVGAIAGRFLYRW